MNRGSRTNMKRHIRSFIKGLLTLHLLGSACFSAEPATSSGNARIALIGYNEHRTNLPGGRQANVSTTRAMLVRADGTGRRPVGGELINEPGVWTQFAGWSPDGRLAIVLRGWESTENARWEEQHKSFRFTPEGWLVDSFLIDLATGKAENITAVERVSFYNTGLFFGPLTRQSSASRRCLAAFPSRFAWTAMGAIRRT